MLEVLRSAEKALPSLLQDRARWHSLFVDYHSPFVERLWCEWNEYRIYLHRIHSCEPGEALFHPHPWPSAMRVLSGEYEMGVGYGKEDSVPSAAATLILGQGSVYEMVESDGWHYVRPLGEPTLSLMVTGKPWGRSAPQPSKPLGPLAKAEEEKLFAFFREKYQ